DKGEGPLSRGRQRTPGSGSPDGGAIGLDRGAVHTRGLRFDAPVGAGGYAWWYIDGVSDDGENAVTIIAFIGSVFSPYYVWSGRNDPLDHVSVNVALYGTKPRWAMTERGRAAAKQAEMSYTVGRSGLSLDGDTLTVTVDERCCPIPRRIQGEIKISLAQTLDRVHAIDGVGNHLWRPVAPATQLSVDLDSPRLSWTGTGYCDMNWGRAPLESDFYQWDWMRVDLGGGESAIFYDTTLIDGDGPSLAMRSDGRVMTAMEMPRKHDLKRGVWGVPRAAWSEEGAPVIRRTLEDTPFYMRTEVETVIDGAPHTAIQESLSLTRLRSPIVRGMLPFRMPRWSRGTGR
ncbi:MAG: carotenoid 1,2-hydratase, partial [Pseudomonadota bacterium]